MFILPFHHNGSSLAFTPMPLYLKQKLISHGIHGKLIEALFKRLSLGFGQTDERDFKVEIWTIQLSSVVGPNVGASEL